MGYEKDKSITRRQGSKGDAAKEPARLGKDDYQFARIELLDAEKKEFRAYLEEGEFTGLTVEYFILQGYKVSYSYDAKEKTVLCSVSMPLANHHNAGLILTGRGGDSVTALAVAAYKDQYLCDGGNWREAMARRGGSRDDIG